MDDRHGDNGEDEEKTSLSRLFDEVAECIRTSPVSPGLEMSTDSKLNLYGLYKHVKDGPCNNSTTSPPSVFQVVARSKYQAWASVQHLSQEEAMRAYVQLAAEHDHHWSGLGIREKLEAWNQASNTMPTESILTVPVDEPDQCLTNEIDLLDKGGANLQPPPLLPDPSLSLVQKYIGVQPLVPRGQLDISYRDLAYAAGQCLTRSSHSISQHCQLEGNIAQLFKGAKEEVVVGLSVRSLLDLYLRSVTFSPDAQVIVVPPINIPGMMDVLQYHNLHPVAVDTCENGQSIVGVNYDAVQKAITDKTVAIMIVHPFGAMSIGSDGMQRLRTLANTHQLQLWEDCAECFTGLEGYQGSPEADLAFFSFGTIKTATALGGGIALVRNAKVAESMRRMQHSLYPAQTSVEYMKKVVLCVMMRFLADQPLLCGLFHAACCWIGVDFDTLVSSSIRSFVVKSPTENKKKKSDTSATRDRQWGLIQLLRKRPSSALLSVLHRRLLQSQSTALSVRARIEQCQYMSGLLEKLAPSVLLPCEGSETPNTFWLFPIQVTHPDTVSAALKQRGWDVPRGASQLQCVSSCSQKKYSCPRAEALMNGVLYLPVASRTMTKEEMHRLAVALSDAVVDSTNNIKPLHTNSVCETCEQLREATSNPKKLFKKLLVIGVIMVAMLDASTVQCIPWSGVLVSAISILFAVAFKLLLLSFLAALTVRWSIADFYLDSSKSFAKYNFLLGKDCYRSDDPVGATSTSADPKASSKPLLNMDALKISCVLLDEGEELRSVLLTGATGFVGSLVLRDLLLHRKTLSIEGGVVVLCRSKYGDSAAHRISRLLDDPMYSFLSKKEKSELVAVVEGDVTKPDAALSSSDMSMVCQDRSISHIIHCAATVSFTQSLEEAAVANISASLNLQSLTKRLRDTSATYVHISTAFVHGGTCGTASNPLLEQLYPLQEYDPAEILESMMGTQFYASSAMNDLGFPNTYTFSKCVCEHLLLREKNVKTLIIRPSIVAPAVEEPFEGWAGNKPSTIVAAATLYLHYPLNLWSFGHDTVPYIPVDVVSRFILKKAFEVDSSNVIGFVTTASESSTPPSSDDDFEKLSISSDSSYTKDLTISTTSSRHIPERRQSSIHTAAWDTRSAKCAEFSWIDYAVAVMQLGSVMGHVSRFTAFVGLFVFVRVLPYMRMNKDSFESIHRWLVRGPIKATLALFTFLNWEPKPIQNLARLRMFIDLPLLFYPFMNNTFHFCSELVAPAELCGERYLFMCAASARRLLKTVDLKTSRTTTSNETGGEPISETSFLLVGGVRYAQRCSDLWWALTQPRGSIVVRLAGWVFIKILRATSTIVSVDAASFAPLAQEIASIGDGTRPHIVLAPNHRSFFDFILLSYVAFAVPELDVDIPYIAAADDFSRLPFLGWFARCANAFYLRRGRGRADPALNETISTLKRSDPRKGVCIEVFVEGKRSRDRRFLPAKTGLLRCLAQTGGEHLVVPICINYEKTPEQSNLADETESGRRGELNSGGLVNWLLAVILGKVHIGRIHVSAASPIRMTAGQTCNVVELAEEIQRKQQSLVCVSNYHVLTASKALQLDPSIISRALRDTDCKLWPQLHAPLTCLNCDTYLSPPISPSQQWTVLLQFGHHLSPWFHSSHPTWSNWLNPVGRMNSSGFGNGAALCSLVKALSDSFDCADSLAVNAIRSLRAIGFDDPKPDHVLQHLQKQKSSSPILLLRAAISFQLDESSLEPRSMSGNEEFNFRTFRNQSIEQLSDPDESLGSWGFSDSGFVFQVSDKGSPSVVMKGNRYSISGKPLRKLIPFIESETKVRIDPFREMPLSRVVLDERECDLTADDIACLKATVKKLSITPADRARHGTGHSQEDIYLIRSGFVSKIRIPDAVVWPSSEDDAAQLVILAIAKNWCLIPFGGGTNVSHATRCPTKDVEPRPIISVDMKLMNRILWVNEEDGVAHVEAGITGRALVDEMKHRGFTIGHQPDSIEFSTLGGWVATKASGMKRNKYGNIEDIVKSVRVAGSEGLMWSGCGDNTKSTFGRESRGIDLRSVVLGSEGCFGIITSAVIRIWPSPECHEYESIIFRSFEHGVRFARDVAKLGANIPASVRVLDNEHFRLGQALRGDPSGLEQCLSVLLKVASPLLGSFSSNSIVCATIVYEGTFSEVRTQRKALNKLASKHGGNLVGSQIGRSAYELTFAIAYLRDFAMTYHFIGESFETFAPWSRLEIIVSSTKKRISDEHERRSLPGVPFIGCRVTQLYHEGACLYFYFCMNVEGVKNPSSTFAEIEHAAREEILLMGGSLSHHHGVGKIRADFAKQMDADAFRGCVTSLKNSIDPSNTFGARNGIIE